MVYRQQEGKKYAPRSAALFGLLLLLAPSLSTAIESGMCRLLSVSDSIKVILVSRIPDKTKYVLDASAAKITVNGKPAEFRDLKYYATAQVKFELKKSAKEGIDLDGRATEIKITAPLAPGPPK
jgi:hypothetical protein